MAKDALTLDDPAARAQAIRLVGGRVVGPVLHLGEHLRADEMSAVERVAPDRDVARTAVDCTGCPRDRGGGNGGSVVGSVGLLAESVGALEVALRRIGGWGVRAPGNCPVHTPPGEEELAVNVAAPFPPDLLLHLA